MTIRSLLVLTTLVWLAGGCTPRAESESPPESILRYHFVGSERVMTSSDGTRLREVAALPESKALARSLLDRLAGATGVFSGGRLSPQAVQTGAPLVRGLLEDVWRRESTLLVQRAGALPLDWSLAVELGPERMGVWRTNLVTLAQVWGLGTIRQGSAGDFPTMEVVGSNTTVRLLWVEAGRWGLMGVGTASMPGLAAKLKSYQAEQRPAPALTNGWLEVSADLAHWAAPLGLPAEGIWPQVEVAWRGDGENLRTAGRFHFAQDATGTLAAWNVPTNLVTEPLVSFAALRGVQPLLEKWSLLGQMGFKPVPDRVFLWAQGSAEGQIYCAFPGSGLEQVLPTLTAKLPQLFPEWARKMGLTDFTYAETNRTVVWRGILPVVAPTLRAEKAGEEDFAVLGLFPPIPAGPPPPDLLAQLARPDLVYYHWEVTQPRVQQWTMLTQLYSMMAQSPQLVTNKTSLPWLQKVGPRLGNTATEVLAVTPKEWTFSRRSHLGLTAAEMVWAARWLEGESFPRPSFLLGQPGSVRRPRPAR